MISGTTPSTMAAVVIRIGRSRTLAASMIASRRSRPRFSPLLVGELDHQDAVLGDQADQRDQADLRVDVERGETEVERHDRAEDRQRHRHHDDERIAEALELRRQHQIDDDDGEAEGDQRSCCPPRSRGATGRHNRRRSPPAVAPRRSPRASARPSPVVTPGSGSAEIVAELSWLNCSMAAGEALVVDRDHRRQRHHRRRSTLRTKNLPSCSGLKRYALRHLRDDVVAVGVAVELRDRRAADEQRRASCRCRRPARRARRRGRGRW